MANFLAELKRRNIYRVGAAYVVVAWALTQFVDVLSQIFELPGSVARPAVIVLALGFPIALIAAWMIESKPHETVVSAVRSKPTIVDWTLCAALALVLVVIGYQQISAPSAQQLGVDAAREAAASPAAGISIAVLPFANMSGDASQEFFSDGMTEEITAALAKISDLRVVARTSAFQFKAQNRDIQSIGQQLHATHFIEGSVRKAGDRLRITAQLIRSDDGTQIWSENYDRELTDVFAIQENIATAIATALRMPLGLAPGERLVSSRTIDAESYQQYLRAKPLVRARRRGVPEAIAILEPLVARNPDYAPAWAQLASAYALSPNYHRNSVDELRRAVDEFLPKAEAAALRAIRLDANIADAYMALGRVQAVRGKFSLAEEQYAKALALDANSPDTLSPYSNLLGVVGRLKEAFAVKQKLRALEPFVPVFNSDAAQIMWLNGQTEAAIEIFKGLGDKTYLPRIYAAMGSYGDAADALLQTPAEGNISPQVVATAARLVRAAPAAAASPQSLPRLQDLSWVYLYVGVPNRALEYYEDSTDGGSAVVNGGDNALLWHSSYAPVRKTERFKAYALKSGMVEYWRERGWPELCRPQGADDFVCD